MAPSEIARGAYGEFFGGLVNRFVDSRDRQAQVRRAEVYHHPDVTLPAIPGRHDLAQVPINQLSEACSNDAFVVDYVADVGDGFGATHAIADLIATSELGGGPGSMLIMGGDQVYPVADDVAYGDRTVGPYQLAFANKTSAADTFVETPVFAIPGNHDWYDGLVSFLSRFARADAASAAEDGPSPARTADPYFETLNLPSVQTRSYFAIALPHNYWIWGVDSGLGVHGRIDLKQIEYFRNVAKLIGGDDRIILCPSEPSWLKRHRPHRNPAKQQMAAETTRIPPDWWDNLLTFLQTVFPGSEGEASPAWTSHVDLIISGDKHFYARHEPEKPTASLPTLVTSGGGGAYLSSTREVPERFATNVEAAGPPDNSVGYQAKRIWPSRERSSSIGLIQGLLELPAKNPYMAASIGVIYGLLAYSSFTGQLRPAFDPTNDRDLLAVLADVHNETSWFATPLLGVRGVAGSFAAFMIAVIVITMLAAFATSAWESLPSRVLATVGHVILHAVALGLTMRLSVLVVVGDWPLLGSLPWAWVDGRTFWLQAVLVLVLISVVIAVPIAVRWWRYRVRELGGLLVVVPIVLALAPVPFLTTWDAQFATGATLASVGALIGGACGLVAFAIYLVASQYGNAHLNELFVGLRVEDYKQFLRLKITSSGVSATAIGYVRVNPRTVAWSDDGTPSMSTPRRAQEAAAAFDTFSVPRR